jgi:hypothetical protein
VSCDQFSLIISQDECTTQEAAHELHFYRQENSPSEDAVKQRFGRQRFIDHNIRSRWVPESDEACTSYSGDRPADLAIEEDHDAMGGGHLTAHVSR